MERKIYSEELSGIKQLTLDMGYKAAESVKLAAQALLENNVEVAAKARGLEKEVDVIYRQIDDRCVVSIAKQQPMAGDLRGISLSFLIQMDVDALKKVLPRISTPTLTEADVLKMDPADLMEAAIKISGFLLKKAEKEAFESVNS